MPLEIPRCRVVPHADHQVAFEIDRAERLRWHYGPTYPRPFFYPVIGPAGGLLTRMGHPGAPNHDHHRSVWFAHQKVVGIDFWSDQTAARIRQLGWLAYVDGADEAAMAVTLGWFDGHDPRELLRQELVAAVRPLDHGEFVLELQATFTPIAESLEFGQTNFGFLAVRVAKSLSEHFGGGRLTSSEGRQGEPAIFGRPARWMDYSGLVLAANGETVTEGLTYVDHASNAGHPVAWHVREDGWMGAAPCLSTPRESRRAAPLRLRYLLHIHRGPVDARRAGELADQFDARPPFVVGKSNAKHQQFVLKRQPA